MGLLWLPRQAALGFDLNYWKMMVTRILTVKSLAQICLFGLVMGSLNFLWTPNRLNMDERQFYLKTSLLWAQKPSEKECTQKLYDSFGYSEEYRLVFFLTMEIWFFWTATRRRGEVFVARQTKIIPGDSNKFKTLIWPLANRSSSLLFGSVVWLPCGIKASAILMLTEFWDYSMAITKLPSLCRVGIFRLFSDVEFKQPSLHRDGNLRTADLWLNGYQKRLNPSLDCRSGV